jgi:hypothetical protein
MPTFAHQILKMIVLGLPRQDKQAKVAQLVERNLAKVKVAGSRPVFRSGKPLQKRGFFLVLF